MHTTLRRWTIADLGILVKYANNKKIWNNMADAFPHPYTEQDGKAFIERACSHNPTRLFAIEYNGGLAGSIGVFPDSDVHRKNAAIAYWIAEGFWGKGIATGAIRLITEYAFGSFDISRVYAKPYGCNIGSARALDKAGFVLEARLTDVIFKNGEFQDELIYGYRKA